MANSPEGKKKKKKRGTGDACGLWIRRKIDRTGRNEKLYCSIGEKKRGTLLEGEKKKIEKGLTGPGKRRGKKREACGKRKGKTITRREKEKDRPAL